MAPKKKIHNINNDQEELSFSDIEDLYSSTANKLGVRQKDDWAYDYDSDSYGNNDW